MKRAHTIMKQIWGIVQTQLPREDVVAVQLSNCGSYVVWG